MTTTKTNLLAWTLGAAAGLAALASPVAAQTDFLWPTNTTGAESCQHRVGGGNATVEEILLEAAFCQAETGNVVVYIERAPWNAAPVVSESGASRIWGTVLDRFNSRTELNITWGTWQAANLLYVRRPDFPAGLSGAAWCVTPSHATFRCQRHVVAFRAEVPERKVVCHETGHAVGLVHGDQAFPTQDRNNGTINGCMATGSVTNETSLLASRHIEQINGNY